MTALRSREGGEELSYLIDTWSRVPNLGVGILHPGWLLFNNTETIVSSPQSLFTPEPELAPAHHQLLVWARNGNWRLKKKKIRLQ